MKVTPLAIPEVLLIEPIIHEDERGYFYESYNQKKFEEVTGLRPNFVQDNHSKSIKGVLRGLHYQQSPDAQDKLVRVVQGEVFDVVVDVRTDSSTYQQWVAEILSAENRKQMWVPKGFAHGFLTLSETAEFLYKTTDYYAPSAEKLIKWDDPTISIEWPIIDKIILSKKDELMDNERN
jgi:dTDP-4-dehydrorhamnose 3,5-epimerase